MIALTLFCSLSVSASTECMNMTGEYLTNRGSTSGHTILTKLTVTQTRCSEITFSYSPEGGHNFSKTYLLDGVRRLSFDDGLTIMFERATLENKILTIDGQTERRYEDGFTKTITTFTLDFDGNLAEYKYIYDEYDNEIGTVITGFGRVQ